MRRPLTRDEIKFLREVSDMDFKSVSVRLKEGEYQYDLAKTIASFQLELYFPNVKDIIARLYGEGKVNDIRFVRKIQTILKKMEKSGLIQIFPKERPWDLQRYAILSYKFHDADKRDVILASDQQIKQAKEKIHTLTWQRKRVEHKSAMLLLILTAIMSGSYLLSIWALTQPIINLLIFIPAFSITIAFSMLFGKALQKLQFKPIEQ